MNLANVTARCSFYVADATARSIGAALNIWDSVDEFVYDRCGRSLGWPEPPARLEYRLRKYAQRRGLPVHVPGALAARLNDRLDPELSRPTVHAVLRLPESATRRIHPWSPGADYIEVTTARTWVRRDEQNVDELHIVNYVPGDLATGHSLQTGALSADQAFSFAGAAPDHPQRASAADWNEQPIDQAHPASRYLDEVQSLRDELRSRLLLEEYIYRTLVPIMQVSSLPQGGFEVGLELSAGPEVAGISLLAGALSRFARGLRAETGWEITAVGWTPVPCAANSPRLFPLFPAALQKLGLSDSWPYLPVTSETA
ncbi:hypothetical protein [Amycolatopsis sp. cmx-4-54]|uniref:hypothetical protein n=1 Tax=Amycolatopsis sp. cmx-4-54 TaxID=2790936 RepID=UPI003978320A